MFKYFTANNTRRYVDVLDEMVKKYNNTRHSSIKMAPVEASKQKNEKLVWANSHGSEPATKMTFKFAVGESQNYEEKGYF